MMEKISSYIKTLLKYMDEDKVTVYAAQASFFVIISVVPCLSLFVTILGFFIPTDIHEIIAQYNVAQEVKDVIYVLLDELQASSTISFLSISIVFIFWAASRGISSIRAGLKYINGTEHSTNIVVSELKALAYTLVMVLILVANIVLIQFGKVIGEKLNIASITNLVMYIGIPILILVMSVVFTVLYAGTMEQEKTIWKTFRRHFPGALIASLGWVIYSFFYSLYITYFPGASYIYGGLTAICLILLWLYFCMVILLLGAEINKIREKGFDK